MIDGADHVPVACKLTIKRFVAVFHPEAPVGMRIRFEGKTTDPKYERLLNLLCYFHGNIPVDIEFVSDGSMMRVDPVCFVSSDPDVVSIIKEFCGEDNVVI